MSAVAFPTVSLRPTLSARLEHPTVIMPHPRRYPPWREPLSERQINAMFERQILPELSVLLEDAFREFSDSDREEAVQDATCQALSAYRTLELYGKRRESASSGDVARDLAAFASARYLDGVRFAMPRSASRL